MTLRFIPHQLILGIVLVLFNFSLLEAQEENNIQEAYNGYMETPREVAYLHLNKSTYIIGEPIGFTAYILDKNDKKPSVLTTNLYVTIEDASRTIIKQKLIEVNNGVAHHTIETDSLFSNGVYNIKAYTNWMRNFNEQNYFIESIKIRDQKTMEISETAAIDHKIDAQFLPESGHILHGVENNIGVIVKDTKGLGIPFVEGEVLDDSNRLLTTFKTNALGIGRFALMANINESYTIKINTADTSETFKMRAPIEKKGVILSVKQLKERLYLSITTNPSTLELIKNKPYTLMLHNGRTSELMDVSFNERTSLTKVIELGDNPGVNILTLFNENDRPVAERLVFNYEGITLLKSDSLPITDTSKDSISIALNYKTIDTSKFYNLSVSVLPKDTKSYKSHHNLISYNYLQPYLQSPVENARYYFTDITEKTKYELDNLLITQGWSSYDWNTIFKGRPNLPHDFEQGIIIKANKASGNLNDNKASNDLLYYFSDEAFLVSQANANQNSYVLKQLFPEDGNTIKLSEITSKNGLKPANLYLQFFPRQVPKLFSPNLTLQDIREPQPKTKRPTENDNVVFKPLKGVQALEEVVVQANPNPALEKRERENQLSRGRFGKVSVVTEQDENSFITLTAYLQWKAWNISSNAGGPNGSIIGVGASASINGTSGNQSTANGNGLGDGSSVNYFLNDVLLIELSRLDELFLSDVDYIEVNRFGLGDGMRSPKGFIKIYTKDLARPRRPKNTATAYEFPLNFSSQKTYYAPKYRYYNDDFFKHYGTIDWKPNLSLDSQGIATVKIAKPEVPITLFIEGIANNGEFVLEDQTIDLN